MAASPPLRPRRDSSHFPPNPFDPGHPRRRRTTMPRRPYSPLSLALALLVAPPSLLSGQTQQRITVEYQNDPLSEVVRGFAAFSGRTIGVAPDVGDPLVTAVVLDVDWLAGLDQILETQSLVA